MVTIQLTKGQYSIINEEDFDRINKWKWQAHYDKKRNIYFASRVFCVNGKRKATKLHRFIMNVQDSKIDVDHINHNTLDNRKQNLRLCDRSKNCGNTRGKSIGFKGVNWHKKIGKWQVRIMKDGKSISIGYFSNEIEAAKAYDNKARELFGEFAYLNFPDY